MQCERERLAKHLPLVSYLENHILMCLRVVFCRITQAEPSTGDNERGLRESQSCCQYDCVIIVTDGTVESEAYVRSDRED